MDRRTPTTRAGNQIAVQFFNRPNDLLAIGAQWRNQCAFHSLATLSLNHPIPSHKIDTQGFHHIHQLTFGFRSTVYNSHYLTSGVVPINRRLIGIVIGSE